MKTLILVGNPEGKYSREFDRDLARVWVEDGKVLVRELGTEFKPFADELRNQLSTRLANPKTQIFSRTGRLRSEVQGITVEGEVGQFSSPEEDNFLAALRGDVVLWSAGRPIAGYTVDTGASYILED